MKIPIDIKMLSDDEKAHIFNDKYSELYILVVTANSKSLMKKKLKIIKNVAKELAREI